MHVILGLELDGPAFVDPPTGRARLGRPVWGPTAFLRDLELRLGIPDDAVPRSVRVPRFAARIRALDDANAFYRRAEDAGGARLILSPLEAANAEKEVAIAELARLRVELARRSE